MPEKDYRGKKTPEFDLSTSEGRIRWMRHRLADMPREERRKLGWAARKLLAQEAAERRKTT
jgi:hypothetical protein